MRDKITNKSRKVVAANHKKLPEKETTKTTEQAVGGLLYRVEVTIVGVRPLLMSCPRDVLEPRTATNSPAGGKAIRDDKYEAERRAYRDEHNGNILCCPVYNIWSMLWQTASKWFPRKRGEVGAAERFKGSVFIKSIKGGDMIPLLTPEGQQVEAYEIDKVVVHIKNDSIPRCRPRIDNWRLDFYIEWNAGLYTLREQDIRYALEKACSVGLMDWRPTNGLFKITKFVVKELTELQ